MDGGGGGNGVNHAYAVAGRPGNIAMPDIQRRRSCKGCPAAQRNTIVDGPLLWSHGG